MNFNLGLTLRRGRPGPQRAHIISFIWHVQTCGTGSVEGSGSGSGTTPKSRLRRITVGVPDDGGTQTQSPPKKQLVVSPFSQVPPGGMAPTPVLPFFAWR